MNAFIELFKLIDPVVKEYRTDIEIDRRLIEDHPGIPFVHVAREMGTHLFMMPPHDHAEWPRKGETAPYLFGNLRRENMMRSMTGGLAYVCKNPGYKFHVFDGDRIFEVSNEEALRTFEEYRDKVMEQWRSK